MGVVDAVSGLLLRKLGKYSSNVYIQSYHWQLVRLALQTIV